MAEAPKIPRIIRERLRVQPGGVRQHPDVDILAAFSEGGLPSGERAQVMNHLSDCGSCREIVMLAQPETVESGQLAKATASRLANWMTFRWAALAACFVLTVGVLLIDRSQRQEALDHLVAPTSPPPAPLSDLQVSTEAESAKVTSEAKLDASEGKGMPAKKLAEQRSAKPAPVGDSLAGARSRMKENSVGRPAEAENFVAQGALGRLERQRASTKEEDSRRADASAPAAIAYDDLSQMHAVSSGRAAGRSAGRIFAGPTAKARVTTPLERNQAAVNPPPPVEAASVAEDSWTSEPGEQEPGKKKVANETQPPAAAPASPQGVLTRDDRSAVAQSLATSASNFQFEAKDQPETLTSNTDKLATASPTPMQWRIRGGKLQQSKDEGKTWEEISIPPGVSLRSFWSLGNSVWAGGTQGSLFHITESGKNSVRIPIKIGEGDVSQTVVAVTFSDELNGIITLENGQILRTTDGGKTWERH